MNKKVDCNNVYECIELYRDVMEGLIDNAVRINKEMGMLFYQDKQGNCTIGNICTGERCSITVIPSKSIGRIIGMFHVHVSGPSILSKTDIYSLHETKLNFSCVGSKKDGIRCYIPIESPEYKKIVYATARENRYVKYVFVPNMLRAAKLLYKLSIFVPLYYPRDRNIKELVSDTLIGKYRNDIYYFLIAYADIMEYMYNIVHNEKVPTPYINKVIDMHDHLYYIYKDEQKESSDILKFTKDNYHKILHECKL